MSNEIPSIEANKKQELKQALKEFKYNNNIVTIDIEGSTYTLGSKFGIMSPERIIEQLSLHLEKNTTDNFLLAVQDFKDNYLKEGGDQEDSPSIVFFNKLLEMVQNNLGSDEEVPKLPVENPVDIIGVLRQHDFSNISQQQQQEQQQEQEQEQKRKKQLSVEEPFEYVPVEPPDEEIFTLSQKIENICSDFNLQLNELNRISEFARLTDEKKYLVLSQLPDSILRRLRYSSTQEYQNKSEELAKQKGLVGFFKKVLHNVTEKKQKSKEETELLKKLLDGEDRNVFNEDIRVLSKQFAELPVTVDNATGETIIDLTQIEEKIKGLNENEKSIFKEFNSLLQSYAQISSKKRYFDERLNHKNPDWYQFKAKSEESAREKIIKEYTVAKGEVLEILENKIKDRDPSISESVAKALAAQSLLEMESAAETMQLFVEDPSASEHLDMIKEGKNLWQRLTTQSGVDYNQTNKVSDLETGAKYFLGGFVGRRILGGSDELLVGIPLLSSFIAARKAKKRVEKETSNQYGRMADENNVRTSEKYLALSTQITDLDKLIEAEVGDTDALITQRAELRKERNYLTREKVLEKGQEKEQEQYKQEMQFIPAENLQKRLDYFCEEIKKLINTDNNELSNEKIFRLLELKEKLARREEFTREKIDSGKVLYAKSALTKNGEIIRGTVDSGRYDLGKSLAQANVILVMAGEKINGLGENKVSPALNIYNDKKLKIKKERGREFATIGESINRLLKEKGVVLKDDSNPYKNIRGLDSYARARLKEIVDKQFAIDKGRFEARKKEQMTKAAIIAGVASFLGVGFSDFIRFVRLGEDADTIFNHLPKYQKDIAGLDWLKSISAFIGIGQEVSAADLRKSSASILPAFEKLVEKVRINRNTLYGLPSEDWNKAIELKNPLAIKVIADDLAEEEAYKDKEWFKIIRSLVDDDKIENYQDQEKILNGLRQELNIEEDIRSSLELDEKLPSINIESQIKEAKEYLEKPINDYKDQISLISKTNTNFEYPEFLGLPESDQTVAEAIEESTTDTNNVELQGDADLATISSEKYKNGITWVIKNQLDANTDLRKEVINQMKQIAGSDSEMQSIINDFETATPGQNNQATARFYMLFGQKFGYINEDGSVEVRVNKPGAMYQLQVLERNGQKILGVKETFGDHTETHGLLDNGQLVNLTDGYTAGEPEIIGEANSKQVDNNEYIWEKGKSTSNGRGGSGDGYGSSSKGSGQIIDSEDDKWVRPLVGADYEIRGNGGFEIEYTETEVADDIEFYEQNNKKITKVSNHKISLGFVGYDATETRNLSGNNLQSKIESRMGEIASHLTQELDTYQEIKSKASEINQILYTPSGVLSEEQKEDYWLLKTKFTYLNLVNDKGNTVQFEITEKAVDYYLAKPEIKLRFANLIRETENNSLLRYLLGAELIKMDEAYKDDPELWKKMSFVNPNNKLDKISDLRPNNLSGKIPDDIIESRKPSATIPEDAKPKFGEKIREKVKDIFDGDKEDSGDNKTKQDKVDLPDTDYSPDVVKQFIPDKKAILANTAYHNSVRNNFKELFNIGQGEAWYQKIDTWSKNLENLTTAEKKQLGKGMLELHKIKIEGKTHYLDPAVISNYVRGGEMLNKNGDNTVQFFEYLVFLSKIKENIENGDASQDYQRSFIKHFCIGYKEMLGPNDEYEPGAQKSLEAILSAITENTKLKLPPEKYFPKIGSTPTLSNSF